MSEFHFIVGTGRGPVAGKQAASVDKIAQKHGATFIACKMPEGYRHWFSAKNMGHPFDEALASAVRAEMEFKGITLP